MKQIYILFGDSGAPVAFVSRDEAEKVADVFGTSAVALPVIGTLPSWVDGYQLAGEPAQDRGCADPHGVI